MKRRGHGAAAEPVWQCVETRNADRGVPHPWKTRV